MVEAALDTGEVAALLDDGDWPLISQINGALPAPLPPLQRELLLRSRGLRGACPEFTEQLGREHGIAVLQNSAPVVEPSRQDDKDLRKTLGNLR